jgi:membrane protein implicated in regulation of membrane protease activity
MTTFQRYLLFQVPGLFIELAVLAALVEWWNMPLWAAVVIFALLAGKDLALYPFLRVGYETREKSGIARLVGERGVVKQRLEPEGYVLVQGELWKARPAEAGRLLEPGARVRVRAFEGMLLLVEAVEPRRSTEPRASASSSRESLNRQESSHPR